MLRPRRAISMVALTITPGFAEVNQPRRPPNQACRAMMQWIRGRAGSIIVKILFGLLIISFGFWGIYTRSDYAGRSPDTVVATVGGEGIRADALQRALEPALERLRAQYGSAIDAKQVKQ